MEPEILKIVGRIAGIGGFALIAFVLLFREVIRKKIFPMLGKEHAYRVIQRFLLLTFLLALSGIVAWVYSETLRRSDSEIIDNSNSRLGGTDSTESALQAEVCLDKAWALLGGEEGLPRLYTPTRDRAKLEQARDEIEKALILKPASIKALRYKSIYLNAIGRRDQAIKLLRLLLAREPNNCLILGELAGLLRIEDELPEAALLAEKAIQLDPDDPSLYINLGMTRSLQMRLVDAEGALRRAIALDPMDGNAHLYLADVLAKSGRIEDAKLEAQTALGLKPDLEEKLSPDARELLGLAL